MRRLLLSILFLSLGLSAQAGETPPTLGSPVSIDRNAVKSARPAPSLHLKPLTSARIRRPLPAKLKNLKPIIPDSVSVKPKGPDPAASLDLSDVIEDPALIKDLGSVCGWDSHLILQDSAAPRVFYYVPRAFLLSRGQDGYRLNVQYNTQAEPGEPSVMVTAELQAPHRRGDVRLLKSILRRAFDLESRDKLRIKAMPGIGAEADLQALTTGLTLPPERIHLTPPAHLKQALRLTLSLTQDETEEVLAQIAGAGLAGTLNVKAGDAFIPVPMRIHYAQFSGPRLKGFDEWADGGSISLLENVTDFPVELKSINAYRLSSGRLERISKRLKPVEIAPGKGKSFRVKAPEKLLGGSLVLAWMGLEMDAGCKDCIDRIDSSIRKGVALAPGSRIHLEAIPSLFEEFGVYKLIVHVKSPYFTAEASDVQKKEVTLTPDENENENLLVFIPSGRGEDPLLYKFRLEAVLETGETRMSPEWENSRKLARFFGSAQLGELLNEKEE